MAQVLPAPCPEVKDDQAGHIFLGPCSEVKYDPEACLTIGQYEEKVTQNAAQLKAVHQQQQLLRESRERRHRQLAGIVSDIQKGEERMINLDTEEISLTSRLAEGRPHRRGSVLDQLWERAEERRASPQVEYVRILVPQRDAVVELDSKDTVVRWLVGATGATALWRVLRLPLAGSFLILPPWASDDGTGVSTLGKTNLHCFLAFFFSFVFFVLSMYRTVTRGGAITGGFKPCSV